MDCSSGRASLGQANFLAREQRGQHFPHDLELYDFLVARFTFFLQMMERNIVGLLLRANGAAEQRAAPSVPSVPSVADIA